MIYGQAITIGGGGGLNISYGTTPPADTSKLWVPLEKKPANVEVNGEFMNFGQNVLETWNDGDPTITSYNTSMNVGFSVCVGDYIYVFDNTKQNILRYDPTNGTFTTCCSYSDVGTVSSYRACKRGTDIYVVGSAATSSLYKFDTIANTLERLMTIPDTGFCALIEYGGYLYEFIGASGSYTQNYAWRIDVDNKSYVKMATIVPFYNHARPCVWVYGGKIWLLGEYNDEIRLLSYDPATDTYTTEKSGTAWSTFGVNYTLTLDAAYFANSPVAVVGKKVYLLPDRKTSGSTVYRNGNPFILDMDTLMFTEGNTVLEADDGYGRVNCGFALYDMGLYLIGGSNYTYNTTSSSATSTNTKVNVYRIETYLTENHLKIFTDMFGKQTALVNGKNCKLYATVREAYLGNEDGYARPTDVYVYNEDTGEWQTVDGVRVA